MVITPPPLISTVPPALVVRLVKGVVPPTAPWKTVAPVVLTVKFFGPLRVLAKVMLPALVLASVLSTPKLTAPL